MSRILITGANGFVGRGLVRRLLLQGGHRLVLIDRQFDDALEQPGVRRLRGSFGDTAVLDDALAEPLDVVYHLASVPGSLAEAELALGHEVNLQTPLALAQRLVQSAIAHGRIPRFVFASSIAVYGRHDVLPASEDDPTFPALTYGAHKLMLEVALADMHRRGDLHVVCVRLPGIVARPRAESGHGSAFMSQVIHHLAAGERYVCPVSADATSWWMSLPCCVDNLLHAAAMARQPFPTCTWQLPVLHLSMRDVVDALERQYGGQCRELVTYDPNPRIERLFGRQPSLRTPRAQAAGFRADASVDALVCDALQG